MDGPPLEDFFDRLMDKMLDKSDRRVLEPVTLNVYDMFWTNNYTDRIGIGVYHSGIEVYGREYAYGGHQCSFSGIFDIEPKQAFELGDQYKFKMSIHLGHISFQPAEFERIIEDLGRQFSGESYHIIHRNCNHFSEALSKSLKCTKIPNWVNRLAYISSFVPFLHQCLPRGWLAPQCIDPSIQYGRSPSISTMTSTLAADDANCDDGPATSSILRNEVVQSPLRLS